MRRVAHPFSLQPDLNVGAPPFAVFEGWETRISTLMFSWFQNEIQSFGGWPTLSGVNKILRLPHPCLARGEPALSEVEVARQGGDFLSYVADIDVG